MKAKEMDAILSKLELDDADLSALVKKTPHAIAKWRRDYGEVKDGGTILLLRILQRYPEQLQDAWEFAGMPDGRNARPRGRPKKEY